VLLSEGATGGGRSPTRIRLRRTELLLKIRHRRILGTSRIDSVDACRWDISIE
jgi:hypothetical protein